MQQGLIHLIQLLKKFIDLKAKVDEIDIDKLANFPTGLNDLKTTVDVSDIVKLNTVSTDFFKKELRNQ